MMTTTPQMHLSGTGGNASQKTKTSLSRISFFLCFFPAVVIEGNATQRNPLCPLSHGQSMSSLRPVPPSPVTTLPAYAISYTNTELNPFRDCNWWTLDLHDGVAISSDHGRVSSIQFPPHHPCFPGQRVSPLPWRGVNACDRNDVHCIKYSLFNTSVMYRPYSFFRDKSSSL